MSPSLMSRMRAPVVRTSAMRSLWRSRSKIITVSSLSDFFMALATSLRFLVGETLRSIAVAASGPTAIFSMYTHGPGLNMEPRSETAITEIAFPRPIAVSVVPSIGSTATSASGFEPFPTRSPLYSMGASSFSPSPMTTIPSMLTVSSTLRIASTAAPSAASLSPRPTQREAASAADSVTRTNSIARLRSGSSLAGITHNLVAIPISAENK